MAQLDAGVCQSPFLFSLSSSTVLIFHIFIFPLIWSLARLPFVVLPTPLGCESFSFIRIWGEIIFETVLCGSVDFLFDFFFFFFKDSEQLLILKSAQDKQQCMLAHIQKLLATWTLNSMLKGALCGFGKGIHTCLTIQTHKYVFYSITE